MLDQLFKFVQQEANPLLQSHPAIPDEQHNYATGMLADILFQGCVQWVDQGALNEVVLLFAGKNSSRKYKLWINELTLKYSRLLQLKFGFEEAEARKFSGKVIPSLLSKLVNSLHDPTYPQLDLNGMMAALTGGFSTHGSPVQLPCLRNDFPDGIDFRLLIRELAEHPDTTMELLQDISLRFSRDPDPLPESSGF